MYENEIIFVGNCNPSENNILHVFGNEDYRNSS